MKNEQIIMDHLAVLLQTIVAYEGCVQELLHGHCNLAEVAKENGCKKLDEMMTWPGLVKNFLVLHYQNPAPCERAMRRPGENEDEIRRIILQKRHVLQELKVAFGLSTPEVEAWLAAA